MLSDDEKMSDAPVASAREKRTAKTVEVFSYEPPQISDVYLVTTNVQEFFKPYGHKYVETNEFLR